MNKSKDQRGLTDVEANALSAGDKHYRAYVGPPSQYDLIGASQFNLLCALGMRERHKVLDFGCGSLRLGRLLIPFLRTGGYYGIEPNAWLVDDAVAGQITEAVVALKQPTFLNNADFNAARAGRNFDFIVAQSIFSHASLGIVETALNGFREALADSGLAAVTVIHPGPSVAQESKTGWVYPECVAHSAEAFSAAVAASGLFGRRIPWFHPRQTWHVLAKRADRLPPARHDQFLSGAILNEPDWAESLAVPGKEQRLDANCAATTPSRAAPAVASLLRTLLRRLQQ